MVLKSFKSVPGRGMAFQKTLLVNSSGASSAEYALILALVGGMIGAAALSLGANIRQAIGQDSDLFAAQQAGTSDVVAAAADPDPSVPSIPSVPDVPSVPASASHGNSANAPGHTGNNPGQSGQTPANGAEAPGQSGSTPGQSGSAPGGGNSNHK